MVVKKYKERLANLIFEGLDEFINDLSASSTTGKFEQTSSQSSISNDNQLNNSQINELKFAHDSSLIEIRNCTKLAIAEMRRQFEAESQKKLKEARRQMELDRQKQLAIIKQKQWCANCSKEAVFYCCWNTSYCDYPCQQQHWPKHQTSCAQIRSNQQTSQTDNHRTIASTTPANSNANTIAHRQQVFQVLHPLSSGNGSQFIALPSQQSSQTITILPNSSNSTPTVVRKF